MSNKGYEYPNVGSFPIGSFVRIGKLGKYCIIRKVGEVNHITVRGALLVLHLGRMKLRHMHGSRKCSKYTPTEEERLGVIPFTIL